jgi:chromosome segregation ATPase
MSQTPRTDAEAGYSDPSGCWKYHKDGSEVPADFARELELELAEAEASDAESIAMYHRARDRAEHHEAWITELRAEKFQLEKQLDAEVERADRAEAALRLQKPLEEAFQEALDQAHDLCDEAADRIERLEADLANARAAARAWEAEAFRRNKTIAALGGHTHPRTQHD